MDTYTPDQREEDWDAYQDEPGTESPLPRRTRRQFFNRRTAALGALITCAIGFYAGIRVEKSQLSSSSTTLGSGARGAGRAGFAALLGRGGSGAGSSGATGSGSGAAGSGSAASGGGGGFPGGGGFGGAGGANASFGTVSSVKGKTIYVTDTSGNTIKVKLSSATKISKTESVSRHAIRPGDTVIVSGVSGSGGTTNAATITDSGNRSSGSSGSGSSGSSSGGSGSGSAVGSLFSSGG
jgi:hypothetical protein